MKRLIGALGIIVLLTAGMASFPGNHAAADENCHTFSETGKTVCDPFMSYWQEHGGLAQQGLPISNPIPEMSTVDGKPYVVQYFERAVFEYHPENNGTPYVVLLSLLGREKYLAKYPNGIPSPQVAMGQDCQAFVETGKTACGQFLAYWREHGGLAQQGLPLSEPFEERNEADGRTYVVQYFERAVFEAHPENAGTPYEVLLSLLGSERLKAQYPSGVPVGYTPPPSPSPKPAPPSPPPSAKPQGPPMQGQVRTVEGVKRGSMMSVYVEGEGRYASLTCKGKKVVAKGIFLVLPMRVTNIGHAPNSIGYYSFQIKEGPDPTRNRVFDLADVDTQLVAQCLANRRGIYHDVQPSLDDEQVFVFDIAKDSTYLNLVPDGR
jgi:hypothetical protein